MTITLHWWAVPVGIVLLGMIAVLVLSKEGSDLFAGFMGAVVFIASLLIAGAVVLGHFL